MPYIQEEQERKLKKKLYIQNWNASLSNKVTDEFRLMLMSAIWMFPARNREFLLNKCHF